MVAVFRYYRNIGVDVPFKICLSVIRVDGNCELFRVTTLYKNARHSSYRYRNHDNGKNNTNDFFAGFHLTPHKILLRGQNFHKKI